MPTKEYEMKWTTGGNLPCTFRIRIFDGAGVAAGKTVTVATDKSSGNCLTHKVELIADEVCKENQIAPEDLIFVEHHPQRATFEETFDIVRLKWLARQKAFQNARWEHSSKEAIEALAGEVLV